MPSPDLQDTPPRRGPLVVIVGPTAVGKTEIALQLAERLGGEIVSADSRLFYRGLDIGTAKPSMEERRRAPHHLIDIVDPDEAWSLTEFQAAASQAIAAIHARQRLPLLVGGTGQYIHAVTQGWLPPNVQPDPRLRGVLENWAERIGKLGLHEHLAQLDPQAAAHIDPRNLRRTVRALEVILSSGQRFSEQRQRSASPYRLLTIGLTRPRPELYARIDARIDAMLEAGLAAEVQGLLDQGYDPALPCLSAIGYREMIAHLQGKISLDEAVTLIKRNTRTFVRRQANWFKIDDPEIYWFTPQAETIDEIEHLIGNWLDA